MTHLRSRGLIAQSETDLPPTKVAWRADRFVAPRDVLELFALIEVKRIPGESGDRFKRFRSGTHLTGISKSGKET